MNIKSMVLVFCLAIVLVTGARAQQTAPTPTQSPAPSSQPAPGPATAPATPPAVQPGAPAVPPAAAPAKPAVQTPPTLFDPFANPGQQMPPQQQQAPGYPGIGGDDGDGYTPPPPPDPVPQNPVEQSYENGKIVVIVGADRHFGYRIGDRVRLSIIVVADQDVKLDFTAISKGVYGLSGSDFETASPAVIQVLGKKDGKIAYRIDLTLRSFVVVKDEIVFNADFLYATDTAPDGKTPNWKRLTTPDFVVSRSATADNGQNLYEGDTSQKPLPISWFTYPLLLAGFMLLLVWPAVIVIRWLNRVRPRRKIPANELAWATFDRVIKDGKQKGFTVKHYKQIAAALRTYLGVESLTAAEIALKLKDHKDLDAIMSALDKFDSVLYDKGFLTDKELRQLTAELKALVPRP